MQNYLCSRKVNTEGAAECLQVRVIYLKTVMPMANPVSGPYVSGFSHIVGVTSVGTDVGIFTFELKFGCLGLWASEEDRRTWGLL